MTNLGRRRRVRTWSWATSRPPRSVPTGAGPTAGHGSCEATPSAPRRLSLRGAPAPLGAPCASRPGRGAQAQHALSPAAVNAQIVPPSRPTPGCSPSAGRPSRSPAKPLSPTAGRARPVSETSGVGSAQRRLHDVRQSPITERIERHPHYRATPIGAQQDATASVATVARFCLPAAARRSQTRDA